MSGKVNGNGTKGKGKGKGKWKGKAPPKPKGDVYVADMIIKRRQVTCSPDVVSLHGVPFWDACRGDDVLEAEMPIWEYDVQYKGYTRVSDRRWLKRPDFNQALFNELRTAPAANVETCSWGD